MVRKVHNVVWCNIWNVSNFHSFHCHHIVTTVALKDYPDISIQQNSSGAVKKVDKLTSWQVDKPHPLTQQFPKSPVFLEFFPQRTPQDSISIKIILRKIPTKQLFQHFLRHTVTMSDESGQMVQSVTVPRIFPVLVLFFGTNFSGTRTGTFLRDQIFPLPVSVLFFGTNFFHPKKGKFPGMFQYRHQIFPVPILVLFSGPNFYGSGIT